VRRRRFDMPAYLIGQVTIHDPAEYEKYLTGFMEAFAPFEGPF
jgi:uncharacterized protein (DUF1330 family)